MLKRRILLFIFLAGLLAGFCLFSLEKNSSVIHQAYFSQPSFYNEAYTNAKNNSFNTQAIIVNHHLLASNYIAEAFNAIATQAPVTVLLVSPNHFSNGKHPIIISKGNWQTPFGKVYPDKKLANSFLKASPLVGIEEEVFDQEHGITGLVGFVKKSLPNAKILPIIFNDKVTYRQIVEFSKAINSTVPKNIVVVGSFDFSHYLTSLTAEFHDELSLNVIQNLDTEKVYSLDIDSKPGLAFYLWVVKGLDLKNFNLLEHSNSGQLTKKDILETTSYIVGYFNFTQNDSNQLNSLLSLGVVENEENIEDFFAKFNPKYSLEYLERLFTGQLKTLAFFLGNNSKLGFELKKRAINLINSPRAEFYFENNKVVFLDCLKSISSNIYTEVNNEAKVVVCQNSNTNKIIKYKNSFIVLTNGSFISQANKTNIAVGVVSQNKTIKLYLFPIGFSNKQYKLLVEPESDKVLIEMANNSNLDLSLKQQIQEGVVLISN